MDLQVHRFPRYLSRRNPAPLARLDDRAPLQGAYSLYLPALSQGGYRITPQVMLLIPGRRYRLSVLTRSSTRVSLTLEAYTHGKLVFSKTVHLVPGEHRTREVFRAVAVRGRHRGGVPYIVYFWLSSKAAIRVDDLSLRGPFPPGRKPWRPQLWMEPEASHVLGVYAAGVHGRFVLRGRGAVPAIVRFRISDPLSGAGAGANHGTVTATALGHGVWKADIPLVTGVRGYYRVEAVVTPRTGKVPLATTRRYAVITPDPKTYPNRALFGLCMEEHGLRTFINAFLRPQDLYGLARDMGVGSVRVFSLLMPDMISRHGGPFDFSQADGALRRIRRNGLSPMFELGSNTPVRIPVWMRSRRPRAGGSFDLLPGIVPRALRERVGRQRRGDYFEPVAYRRYLDAVFRHFGDRIPYYEVWNEPAWKFTARDFLKIVRLTRSEQRRFAPSAHLVGFSSTIGGRDGDRAPGPFAAPSFLKTMAAAGALGDIDVLSYHGAHAFQFLGPRYDRRDLRKGFVARIRRILAHNGHTAMPIWDTEFGIPWTEPGTRLADFRSPRRLRGGNERTVGPWDVARQLPMIYAAAMASGVRRVFWFGLAQSLPTILYPGRMWGLFDPGWQPMPQIPVYKIGRAHV